MLMRDVERVDIEGNGDFQFLMIKVKDVNPPPEVPSVTIIRGLQKYRHSRELLEDTERVVYPLKCEPLGGGYLSHVPENRIISITGESDTFGRADPQLAAEILQMSYPDYEIEIPCGMCLPRPIE